MRKIGRNRLAFALDYSDLAAARAGAEQVRAAFGVLKVGLELFVKEGPRAVAIGPELGCDIFLDLKLHDIPETVERAVASAIQHGVQFLTLHASGGPRMLEAAANRVQKEGSALRLLAISVLTSLDAADLAKIGVQAEPAAHAVRLARLARDSGVNGAVCSAHECAELRKALGSEFFLVTPGIRPAGNQASDDQKRVATPGAAIQNGADLLVIGRPVRDAANPSAAALAILEEVEKYIVV